MFNFERTRFRSPERDRQTDQARLASIQNAIRSTTANAEREFEGLRGRVENARRTAGMLLEKMEKESSGDNGASELRRLEERLTVAEVRIVQLRKHLAALERIENTVNVVSHSARHTQGGTQVGSQVGRD
jgi:hypothetical protein